ncbi:MAG: TauD/TfdA family dioxygenase [Candidatus Cyclonatronum sp.]|uniref:TauD/TfdA family dioxygenase n=1 Tax=Cyclonatronum sp. TaxID=3024185 RepID=UPI0025C0ACA0|nr:TauD/TfdA family dioxygenase [Cyclonatronum sp.]MCH8487533.1 TauD/TfdA family dioxygenase [Cyclonatronum sp.]
MIDYDLLLENGYFELSVQDSELYSIAKRLGEIQPSRIDGPDIDLIQPKTIDEAHPHSLSANYGTGTLPFHTDGAYFKRPPKYIILRCLKISSNKATPTILINPLKEMEEQDADWLKYETWKVKSRSGIFYTSVLNTNITDEQIIRYDPVCMKPAYDMKAIEKLMAIFEKCNKTYINWVENKTVIINNWKLLHFRPSVDKHEINYRTLQRVMIL